MIKNKSDALSYLFNIENFYKCGMQGLSEVPYSPLYDHFMHELLSHYPALQVFIGAIPIYQTEGNGWTLSFKNIGKTYGLTFQGIEEVLNILGMKEVKIADSAKKLKEIFAKLNEPKIAIITDAQILKQKDEDEYQHHAISLFVEKTDSIFKLFINDSLGGIYYYDRIKDLIPNEFQLELIKSEVGRQETNDATCNAFAITDCQAFVKKPYLLEEMKQHIIKNSDKEYVITQLPQDLLSLYSSNEAKRKALDFQLLLIKKNKIHIEGERREFGKIENEKLYEPLFSFFPETSKSTSSKENFLHQVNQIQK